MGRWPLLIALGCVALILTGCGGSGGDSTSTHKEGERLSSQLDRPEVVVHNTPPPTKLVVKEVVEGDGTEAKPGKGVTVEYHIVDYRTGRLWDSSWDHTGPWSFKLGAHEVIPGMEKGIDGMKIGGRRELVVPPDLGFSPKNGSLIGPNPVGVNYPKNETLVVIVDLLEVL
jgi:FKBP-type peptidyl-prolyl cis-trans isomerase